LWFIRFTSVDATHDPYCFGLNLHPRHFFVIALLVAGAAIGGDYFTGDVKDDGKKKWFIIAAT